MFLFFFFFKQKTAYEMRISDWSSDVCSSDLQYADHRHRAGPFAASVRRARRDFGGERRNAAEQRRERHSPTEPARPGAARFVDRFGSQWFGAYPRHRQIGGES